MAVTKGTGTAILTAVTTTQTSSAFDVSGAYAVEVYAKMVVVGTPTVSGSFVILQSPDAGTTYYTGPSYNAVLAAGTYYWGPILLGATVGKFEVTFTQQTSGTSSTFTAQYNTVTGI